MNLLSYSAHYTSLQTNLLASEAFLDSSALRSSIISKAKTLSYFPNQKIGSIATVNMKIPKASVPLATQRLTVNKGTTFASTLSGDTLSFYVVEDSVLSIDSDNFLSGDIKLRQGNFPNGVNPEQKFVFAGKNVFDNLGRRQRFILSNPDIDINSIEVKVNSEVWVNSSSAPNLISPESKVYFLQETEDGKVEVYFGDDLIGKSPLKDEVIEIDYSISAGAKGNGFQVFNLLSTIETLEIGLFNITTLTNSEAGAEKEADSSIKLNAPAYYESQGRAVVDSDYSELIKKIHSDIKSISSFGGNKLTPAQPGKVFVSIQTLSGFPISPSIKANIVSKVNRLNVGKIQTEIVDNNYIDVNITSNVLIDSSKTNLTDNALTESVISKIDSHFDSVVGLHNANLVSSKLSSEIDSVNTSVIGNTTTFKLSQQLILADQQVGNYTIDFGNEIKEKSFNILLAPPTTSLLSYNGVIEDSGNKDSLGRNILVGRNIVDYPELDGVEYGTIDLKTGLVLLTNFIPSKNIGTGVTVSAETTETSVEAKLNTLFRVGTLNITIERQ